MTAAHDVAIVGGGVAGLTLAFELARRSVRVVLLEGGQGPTGGSTVPTALLNPHRGRTARARPSDLAGLTATWRLVEELQARGLAHGARRSGVVRVASNARQAKLWRGLAAVNAGTRWLEPADVPPSVNAPFGALHVLDGGFVDTRTFLSAVTRAAVQEGAEFLTSTRVSGIRESGAGLELEVIEERREDLGTGHPGTALADRAPTDRVFARRVVLCVGASSAPQGCRLPRLAAEGGVAAVLEPPAHAAELAGLTPLAGAVNAAFLPGSVVVTGGSLPPERPDQRSLHAAALGLRDALSWSVPALADAALRSVWFGVRSRRPSGTPVVRRLGPRVTYYGGLAGRGFLCAAELSAELARRLTA